MMIILAGVFLNFTVTFINGGKMPLSLDAAAMAGLAENGNVFAKDVCDQHGYGYSAPS